MNLKKETWKEMLLLIGVMAVFSILGLISLPYMLILIPAPFIVFNIKNNIFLGNLSFIVIALGIGIAIDFSTAIIFLILFIPIINTMSYLILKKEKYSKIVFNSTIALFISFLVILVIASMGDQSVGQTIEMQLKEVIDSQLEVIETSNLSIAQIDDVGDIAEKASRYVVYILPSMIFISCLVMSYINSKLVYVGLERLDIKMMETQNFNRYKLPRYFILGIMIISVIVLLLENMKFVDSSIVYSNIVFLTSFFILIQGVAVIDYFLASKKVFVVIRIFLISMIFFVPTMLSVVYFIGVLDYIFNLRKI